MDRFGPCSACPSHGINCVNDTAILAPRYYRTCSMTSEKLHKSRPSLFPAICVGPLINCRRTQKASVYVFPPMLIKVDSSKDHLIDKRLKPPTKNGVQV